jgi:hypothetical protein
MRSAEAWIGRAVKGLGGQKYYPVPPGHEVQLSLPDGQNEVHPRRVHVGIQAMRPGFAPDPFQGPASVPVHQLGAKNGQSQALVYLIGVLVGVVKHCNPMLRSFNQTLIINEVAKLVNSKLKQIFLAAKTHLSRLSSVFTTNK